MASFFIEKSFSGQNVRCTTLEVKDILGQGGNISLNTGTIATGNGGSVVAVAGNSTLGNGGNVALIAGWTATGQGGQASIAAGSTTTLGPAGSLLITGGSVLGLTDTTSAPGSVLIAGGIQGATSPGAVPGGSISLVSGASNQGNGGNATFFAGESTTVGNGGNMQIIAGNSATGNGGNASLTGGSSSTLGNGGSVELRGGNATGINQLPGNVRFTAGFTTLNPPEFVGAVGLFNTRGANDACHFVAEQLTAPVPSAGVITGSDMAGTVTGAVSPITVTFNKQMKNATYAVLVTPLNSTIGDLYVSNRTATAFTVTGTGLTSFSYFVIGNAF